MGCFVKFNDWPILTGVQSETNGEQSTEFTYLGLWIVSQDFRHCAKAIVPM